MFGRIPATLRGLISRRRAERELDEELRFHVEMETQANTAAGMSPAEARRVAMRDLGGITQTTESVHSVRTLWLDTLSRDAHLAIRRVRRQPAISTCIVFPVALGVAVTAAVFSVLDAAVFKPLPFSKSDELIAFGGRPTRSEVPLLPVSPRQYFDVRDNQALAAVAVMSPWSTSEGSDDGQPAIKGNPELGPLEEGEAAVWYLGHCGYAVKTKNKLLVFDYSKAYGRRGDPTPPIPPQPSLSNGWIDPKEIKDLDVVVFITHSHADHFDEAIRAWEEEIPRIQYVFGWDTGGVRNVHSLPGPRAELSLEGLTIATVNSNDGVPGSAFLIRVDGLTIFFGGDYYGGPAGVADDMRALGAKVGSVDLLFTEAFLTPANDTAIRILKPRVVFPNHRGGHEEEYPAFAASLKKAGLDVPVARPERPGSRFDFRKGRILQGEGNARNSLQTPSPRPIGEKGEGR